MVQIFVDLVIYFWSVNNGVMGDQFVFIVIFDEVGVGIVFLEVIDVNGCIYFIVIEDDLVDCGDDFCEGFLEL